MLARGANPNATSIFNETALSFAIREGTMKVVKKLLELDMMDTSRGDLLHCSVQREASSDTAELIDRMILKKNAQVDAYEYDNDIAGQWRYGFPLGTPLHIPCEMTNITAVEALFRHGANAHQLKKQCNDFVPPTPLELATDKPDLLELLFEGTGNHEQIENMHYPFLNNSIPPFASSHSCMIRYLYSRM